MQQYYTKIYNSQPWIASQSLFFLQESWEVIKHNPLGLQARIVKLAYLCPLHVNIIWKLKFQRLWKFSFGFFALEKLNMCSRLQKRLPTTSLAPSWCILCRKEDKLYMFFFCTFAASCCSGPFKSFDLCWVFPKRCTEAFYQLIKRGFYGSALWWYFWGSFGMKAARKFFEGVSLVDDFWDQVRLFYFIWCSLW